MTDRDESQARKPDVAPRGWQARKSAATRQQILDATLSCFSKVGYFHTSTPMIAEAAGLSRGAMLHHFPSRTDVVRAAVEHLHAKRLKAFRAAVDGLPPGENRARAALRAHWDQLRHPLYAVFIELYVAARTDPELSGILASVEGAFARELRATAMEVVPEWRIAGKQFEIGYDLVICALQGMALNLFKPGAPEPSEEFFGYLEQRLDELVREAQESGNAVAPERAAAH